MKSGEGEEYLKTTFLNISSEIATSHVTNLSVNLEEVRQMCLPNPCTSSILRLLSVIIRMDIRIIDLKGSLDQLC